MSFILMGFRVCSRTELKDIIYISRLARPKFPFACQTKRCGFSAFTWDKEFK